MKKVLKTGGAVQSLARIVAPFLAAAGLAAQPSAVEGRWEGTLRVSGAGLPLVFTITVADDGRPTATMDSPDQGAFGIPAGDVEVEGAALSIPVPAIGGEWRGALEGDSLVGAWRQGGQSFPLVLRRGGEAPGRPARPQDPAPPYPYDSDEVRVAVAGADVVLAGTLTRPPGPGPFPAAVLIPGSGPQNRDEQVMGHRVFAVLADALTRAGIAVLRVDDRGVGESTGDFAAATTDDLALDAAASVEFLRGQPRIDPERVGVVGHSEGGLIAAMIGEPQEVAFAVLLAGPALPGEEVLVGQIAHQQRLQGVPPGQVEANTAAVREVARVLRTRPRSVWDDEVLAALETAVPPGVAVDLSDQARAFTTPWMARFLEYDPRPELAGLRAPVLALFAELDAQVLPAEHAAPMRQALAHNTRASVEVLAGLNHLFQPAGTGLPDEYARIETTLDPSVLERITAWILEVSGPAGGLRR